MEASLKRIGTDYIDLFQVHGFDALTPVEEVLSTLDNLTHAGKIRYIGASNFSGWHLMKALGASDRLMPSGWQKVAGSALLASSPRSLGTYECGMSSQIVAIAEDFPK